MPPGRARSATGRCSSSRSNRSTGSGRGRWGPTRSESVVERSLAGIRAFDAGLPGRLAAGEPGTRLTAERAEIVDGMVRDLFEGCAADGVALAAIGGYGA